MAWLQAFFSSPARQALGWTVLGILGIGMAAGGVWFLTDDGGGTKTADADERTPTMVVASPSATATRANTATPSATATATPTLTPEATPTIAPTIRPATNTGTGGSGGNNNSQAPAPEPTPVPTEPPVVAGGAYCPNDSSSSPPNSVIGVFTIGGAPAPAGSAVSLAFDGVIGPTRLSSAAGGYRVDYFAGPEACANRVGAAIAVVFNGGFYPTGHTIGDSPGAPVNMTLAIP